MYSVKKKQNRSNKILILLLLIAYHIAITTAAKSQNTIPYSSPSILNQDDTVFVYKNGVYFTAGITQYNGKKIWVKPFEDFNNKKPIKVNKKFVFHPLHKNNILVPKTLRFRQTDNLLADDIIIKGTVIGFNKHHFLLKYSHNHSTEIVVKHKSEIVQRDLKP